VQNCAKERGQPLQKSHFPSRRVLATGEPERGQIYALMARDGRRWIRVAAQPVRATGGHVTGSVTSFTDVTERVQAQTALRESAARLDLALGAARMGVWEYEPASDEGWWSPNLFEIFDMSDEQQGLGAFLEHVHVDDRDGLRKVVDATIAGEDGCTFEKEFRVIGRDGVTRWARTQGRLTWITNIKKYIGLVR